MEGEEERRSREDEFEELSEEEEPAALQLPSFRLFADPNRRITRSRSRSEYWTPIYELDCQCVSNLLVMIYRLFTSGRIWLYVVYITHFIFTSSNIDSRGISQKFFYLQQHYTPEVKIILPPAQRILGK